MIINQIVRKITFVSLLAFLASGCATQYRTYHNTENLGTRSITEHSEIQPPDFRLEVDIKPNSGNTNGPELEFSIHELASTYTATFERIRISSETTRITNNPLCWLFGHPRTSELCHKDRTYKHDYVRRNETRTPAKEDWNQLDLRSPGRLKHYRFALVGLNTSGQRQSDPLPVELMPRKDWLTTRSINLRQQLQRLPEPPVSAIFLAERTNPTGEVIFIQETKLDQRLIAGLSLFSENWLNVDEKKALYMEKLKDALIASRDFQAVRYFDVLMALPISLPDVFYFQFAETLGRTHNYKRAAELYETYLSKAGSNGKYSEQAAEQLKQLKP